MVKECVSWPGTHVGVGRLSRWWHWPLPVAGQACTRTVGSDSTVVSKLGFFPKEEITLHFRDSVQVVRCTKATAFELALITKTGFVIQIHKNIFFYIASPWHSKSKSFPKCLKKIVNTLNRDMNCIKKIENLCLSEVVDFLNSRNLSFTGLVLKLKGHMFSY